jgi:hypothetical protein
MPNMPNRDEIYNIWAPLGGLWSPWVKPVLFSFTDAQYRVPLVRSIVFQKEWIPRPGPTGLVIDLPEEEGVLWGIRLAELGYRPVPLYNALPFAIADKNEVPSSRPTTSVHVEPIVAALVQQSDKLANIHLPLNAPPSFLLDADRRIAKADLREGIFDNRSICFSTDFPSASFLLEHGIRNVVVVQETAKFARDVLDPLLAWQAAGIEILRKTYKDVSPPVAVTIRKPSFLSKVWFKLSALAGLRRGELGGFGDIVRASG